MKKQKSGVCKKPVIQGYTGFNSFYEYKLVVSNK